MLPFTYYHCEFTVVILCTLRFCVEMSQPTVIFALAFFLTPLLILVFLILGMPIGKWLFQK